MVKTRWQDDVSVSDITPNSSGFLRIQRSYWEHAGTHIMPPHTPLIEVEPISDLKRLHTNVYVAILDHLDHTTTLHGSTELPSKSQSLLVAHPHFYP